MKRFFCLVLTVIIMLSLTSCSLGNRMKNILFEDNNSIANSTFEKVVESIKNKDSDKLISLFSPNIKNTADLSEDAHNLIEFVKGNIISFSDARDSGVGASYHSEHGKKQKILDSSFTIITEIDKYYLSIFECTHNDFDKDNVGIISIYVIGSDQWNSDDPVYRGNDIYSPGINLNYNPKRTKDIV